MTRPITENTLFYGDNLYILRDHIPDESVDLIYLDPPFNSNRSYNVLFKDESGKDSESQITAFEDTWHWNDSAEEAYHELTIEIGGAVGTMIGALRSFVGNRSQMMAYLVMMAVRLVELHRVLKPTGSIYLHCDPAASHYLKVVLDTIFSPQNFRNEIIWRRTNAHNKLSKQYGPIHDVILFYTKSDNFIFHPGRRPYTKGYVEGSFPYEDQRGKYQSNVLTGSGTRTGDSGKSWKGYNPTLKGRHWAIPSKLSAELGIDMAQLTTQQILDLLDEKGLILAPQKPGSLPRYKQYLDISEGTLYQDIWAYQSGTSGLLLGSKEGIDEDVKWLDADNERLGYPTQKPLGLLERIIKSSCPDDGWVLDPFCGCGTTIAAAQKLKRQWIGIDITYLSISLLKYRLKDMFGDVAYRVIGEPNDLGSARQLAQDDRYQFQWWAGSLIKAKPLGGQAGSKTGKKGSDKGIDGEIIFIDEAKAPPKKILVQVKSGHVTSGHIRDLRGTLERENAAMGVYITLDEPTRDMRTEATTAGYYESPGWGQKYPKIQILTIAELLRGAELKMPPTNISFRTAEHVKDDEHTQKGLFD